MSEAPATPLLRVVGLRTEFRTAEGSFFAVDGISFEIGPGEVLALVGESGCGKSATALSLLRLVEAPGRVVAGTVELRGQDLLRLSDPELRAIRGQRIGMVFQEPMTSLNPVFTVGDQVAEAIRAHKGASRGEARARTLELFRQVGIPAPEQRVDQYPHQLSGGLRQRTLIAMALACDPELLIADEPTTALDVTLQAEILDLLRRLRQERHLAVLLITHDLGIVAEQADQVVVMYAGKIVERAPAASLFRGPRHPYTAGLLASVPTRDRHRLRAIPGTVPWPHALPSGCRFRDRCPRAQPDCAAAEPPLAGEADHLFACFHPLPAAGA